MAAELEVPFRRVAHSNIQGTSIPGVSTPMHSSFMAKSSDTQGSDVQQMKGYFATSLTRRNTRAVPPMAQLPS
jgi:hypothetical protein